MKKEKQIMRTLYEIAAEVRKDWKKVNYAAKPYLEAMESLGEMDEMYGADSAKTIVLYFLANAGTWRGEVAKKVKAELKSMAASKTADRAYTNKGVDPEKKYWDGYATNSERFLGNDDILNENDG